MATGKVGAPAPAEPGSDISGVFAEDEKKIEEQGKKASKNRVKGATLSTAKLGQTETAKII